MLASFIAVGLLARQGPDHARALDDAFAEYVRRDAPGIAVGVFSEGRIVFAKGFGLADVEKKLPITPDTVFEIQSTSKQFTAACVALLAHDKRLSWKDDIRKFVPELKTHGKRITLDHLAHHTSGLADCTLLFQLAGKDVHAPISVGNYIASVNSTGLNFNPGAQHGYSNTNYILLAEVVRRVSKLDFGEFATEQIFKPLGMTSTRFASPESTSLLAVGYNATDKGFIPFASHESIVGHGGLLTTIRDLAKWDGEFYGSSVLGQEVMDSLLEPLDLKNGFKPIYGRGLMIGSFRGKPSYRHDGGDIGWSAELVRVPSVKGSVAVLANRDDVNPTAIAGTAFLEFFGTLVSAPPAPKWITVPLERRQKLSGYYKEDRSGKIWRISATETAISMRSIEDGGAVVQTEDLKTFHSLQRKEFNLTFEDGVETATRQYGREQIRLTRLPSAQLSKSDLDKMAGKYESKALGIKVEVERSGDGLRLQIPEVTTWNDFQPVTTTYFMGETLSVKVSSSNRLRLSHMRAANIDLTRIEPRSSSK